MSNSNLRLSASYLALALLVGFAGVAHAHDEFFSTEADDCVTCSLQPKTLHKKRAPEPLFIPIPTGKPTQSSVPHAEVQSPAVRGGLFIKVSLNAARMYVYNNGKLIKTYPVGTGGKKDRHGRVHNTQLHPKVGRVDSIETVHKSRLYNNFPLRWAIHMYGNFFIHAGRTGQRVSNGCIHLEEKNAKALFQMVKKVGTKNVTYSVSRS